MSLGADQASLDMASRKAIQGVIAANSGVRSTLSFTALLGSTTSKQVSGQNYQSHP